MDNRMAALLCLLLGSSPAAETGKSTLTYGGLSLRPGMVENEIIPRLKERYEVRQIDGGWEVRTRQPDNKLPMALVGVESGKVTAVQLAWLLGMNVSLETISDQLARALPEQGSCRVSSESHSHEGGIVRRMRFQCDDDLLSLTIRSEQGDVSSADIALESISRP